MNDLYGVFSAHHWKLDGNCLFSNVKPDLLGVNISVNKDITKIDDLPPHAKTLGDIFKAAKIAFYVWSRRNSKGSIFHCSWERLFP